MLEPAFEALGPMLESGDPAKSLDYLIGQFRESKDYHLMFEAKLMKKRQELGLPLIQAPNLGALPPDVQTKYQQFLIEAAQETGEFFWRAGTFPKRGRIFAPRATQSGSPRLSNRRNPPKTSKRSSRSP